MSKKLTLIVGCGLTGCVIANILANNGEKVLIIDKRSHIGGNVYDYDVNGITVQKYGPHIFHTNNEIVWNFLSQYTEWNDFIFKPLVMIDGREVNLPFNLNSLYQCFPSDIAEIFENELINNYGFGNKISITELMQNNSPNLKKLADFIFSKIFKNYTKKQWGVFSEQIDKSILSRVPVVIDRDNRYFPDKYQGIPAKGYTFLIKRLLGNDNISVKLNTEYIKLLSDNCDKIIYTGSIDEYFDYKYGELSYRSLNFDIKTFKTEYYQNAAMVNYPNENNFTRITEHKYFLNEKSDSTVVSFEYPCDFQAGVNERFYPIDNNVNKLLYEKYYNEAKQIKNVYFAGRLGTYKYCNMDTAVENAIKLANSIINS